MDFMVVGLKIRKPRKQHFIWRIPKVKKSIKKVKSQIFLELEIKWFDFSFLKDV